MSSVWKGATQQMSRPLTKCCDGATQHWFEQNGVVGREGKDTFLVEYVCVDCGASYVQEMPIDETDYVASKESD